MGYKIAWDPSAKEDLRDYIRYLKAEWGQGVSLRFDQQLRDKLRQLTSQPDTFPISRLNNSYRSTNIDNHTAILFRIDRANGTVAISYFHHHARNPGRLT